MKSLFAVLLTAALFAPATAATAQVADINCDDPALYSYYQTVLRSDPSDPNDLDRDKDGEACDEFGPGTASAAPRTVNNLRREVGYSSSTNTTFQLPGQPPVPAVNHGRITPPQTGDAGLR